MRYFLLLLSFISYNAYAQNLNLELKLDNINIIQTTEKGGDELYFNVMISSKTRKPTNFNIPEEPMHWYSKQPEMIKDISLAKVTVKENEELDIIVSLIEKDSPPWLLDDHIGSILLTSKNDGKKLDFSWSQPNYVDQPEVKLISKSPIKYSLKGDGGDYEIQLSIH